MLEELTESTESLHTCSWCLLQLKISTLERKKWLLEVMNGRNNKDSLGQSSSGLWAKWDALGVKWAGEHHQHPLEEMQSVGAVPTPVSSAAVNRL